MRVYIIATGEISDAGDWHPKWNDQNLLAVAWHVRLAMKAALLEQGVLLGYCSHNSLAKRRCEEFNWIFDFNYDITNGFWR